MFRITLILLALQALSRPLFVYDDPATDRAIRHAIAATYDLDLTEARKTARSLQRSLPDHPVGYLLDAETYWWEAQTDPTRQEIEEEYFRVQERTVDVGEKALKGQKYPAVEIKAYLASVWGSKARFRLTQHGVGLKTVLDGRTAHGYAEDVYKADPKYTDILVGIGAYNYFTGKIPAVLKPFAFLFGAHGDAAEGLRQIREVAQKGRYAQTEAQIVLYTALLKDGQFEQSYAVLRELLSAHPANYAMYPWVTQWYREQTKTQQGVDYFEKLALSKLPGSPRLAQYALYEKAILQSAQSLMPEARATLTRLRGIAPADPGLLRSIRVFEATLKK